MIVYIAGRMTGLPDLGRYAFHRARVMLEHQGHTVLNPADLPTGLPKAAYMPICMTMIETADAVYLLKGWEDSPGAQVERAYAEYQGKRILFERRPGDGEICESAET